MLDGLDKLYLSNMILMLVLERVGILVVSALQTWVMIEVYILKDGSFGNQQCRH